MMDHTYCGTPVSCMSTEDIYDCLNEGFCIIGEDDTKACTDWRAYWIRLRLEVELLRRSLGLPILGQN